MRVNRGINDQRTTIIVFALVILVVASIANTDHVYGSADKWKITQYRSKHVEAMAYTIESPDGKLAIVDGGWKSDAQRMLNVIQEHDNTVDAWIITHPHPDHLGVINRIMKGKKKGKNTVRIRRIYTIRVDTAHYKNHLIPADRYDLYKEFRSLIKREKVTYVKENKTYRIVGLKMKVFNAWPKSYLRNYNYSLCNNGSMVFKLSGKKRSMLFCGDIRQETANRVIYYHKNELRSTFVQCAHHGRDGVNTRFYDYVKAKKAFFDASEKGLHNKTFIAYVNALMSYFKRTHTQILKWNSHKLNTVCIK